MQEERVAVQMVFGDLLHAGGEQEAVEEVAGGDALHQQRCQGVDVVEQIRQCERRPQVGYLEDGTGAAHRSWTPSATRCLKEAVARQILTSPAWPVSAGKQ